MTGIVQLDHCRGAAGWAARVHHWAASVVGSAVRSERNLLAALMTVLIMVILAAERVYSGRDRRATARQAEKRTSGCQARSGDGRGERRLVQVADDGLVQRVRSATAFQAAYWLIVVP